MYEKAQQCSEMFSFKSDVCAIEDDNLLAHFGKAESYSRRRRTRDENRAVFDKQEAGNRDDKKGIEMRFYLMETKWTDTRRKTTVAMCHKATAEAGKNVSI